MTKIFLTVTILLIIAASCAVQQPVIKEKKIDVLKIPSGIDTLTTIISDSIFSLVAVEEKDENKAREYFEEAQFVDGLADSLWIASEKELLNRQDSIIVLRQLLNAEKYLQLNQESYKQIKKMVKKTGELNYEVLLRVSKELTLQAVVFFENSIKENRFEIVYRQRLSQILQKLGERLHDRNYLIHAAEELERVVFVIKESHQLYYDLGEIYFKLKDWNNAFKNYDLAKNALRKSAIFSIQNPVIYFDRISEVPLDTNRLVGYLYQQAICKTKLYEAQPALVLYREVKDLTPDIELKKLFETKIEWILWDDGNISASEIKDKGDTLRVLDKNYSAAKNVYLELLLPILWTRRTKDEINWRIAQIDFQHLGNKAEGVQRMFYIIKNSAVDSLTGAPLDSNYVRYFDDYGRMCFNLGNEFFKKDKLTAYIYFQQAAAMNYQEQAKAFLQLAQISQFDPHETINLCKKTMDYLSELDDSEKVILYKILHRAYRKLGDFKSARHWFEQYKSF